MSIPVLEGRIVPNPDEPLEPKPNGIMLLFIASLVIGIIYGLYAVAVVDAVILVLMRLNRQGPET